MGVIAAIHSGGSYQLDALERPPAAGLVDRALYLPDLAPGDLDGADVVLVVCRTDPDLLAARRDLFEALLAEGRTVVAMGETEPQEWLPGIVADPLPANWWWWLTPGADGGLRLRAPDRGLFRRITLADCTWHRHAHYRVPAGAVSLVDCVEGGSVLYDDAVSTTGRMIVTGLDPFYHHGSRFMPATSRFLAGFLPWLKDGAPVA
jgi:hypothetical protein